MNKLVTLMTCALLVCGSAIAADPVRHQQVELTQGTALKKLSGKIKGNETVEYRIAVPTGGALSLKLKSANRSTNFNVSAERAEEAIFVGSRDGDRFMVTAPAGAVYKVSVYLMRNAARRQEKASYVIEAVASSPTTPR